MAPSKNERDIEIAKARFNVWLAVINQVGSVVKACVWAGAIAAIVYYGIFRTVEVAAGQETSITYFVKAIFDLQLQVWVAWGAAAAASAWAYNEKRLRKKERVVDCERIADLERQIDPNRTSSGIDADGKARKGRS